MSKRVSPEFKIVSYFRTEELGKAQALLGIVSQEVRERTPKAVRGPGKPKGKTPKVKGVNAHPTEDPQILPV